MQNLLNIINSFGYNFDVHFNNVDGVVNNYNEYLINTNQTPTKENFLEYLSDYTVLNTCDCCGCIDNSEKFVWDMESVYVNSYGDYHYAKHILGFDAVCTSCINKAENIKKFSLSEIKDRIIDNNMLFREKEAVVYKNEILTIKSLDTINKSYEVYEYPNITFMDKDFDVSFDYAIVQEYDTFIAKNYDDIVDEVDEWSEPNWEGIPEIDMAYELFGYENEFINYLKDNNLYHFQ